MSNSNQGKPKPKTPAQPQPKPQPNWPSKKPGKESGPNRDNNPPK